jgi:hypothetical protein
LCIYTTVPDICQIGFLALDFWANRAAPPPVALALKTRFDKIEFLW